MISKQPDISKAQIAIEKLLCYGVNRGLILQLDKIYCRNMMLDILDIPEPLGQFDKDKYDIPYLAYSILDELTQYAVDAGIIEDNATMRDLLDTKIMATMCALPSTLYDKYNSIKNNNNSKDATDWFFDYNAATNYIRQERIDKNIKWAYEDEIYGQIDITINLSKPEKNSKEIAKLLGMPKSGYPACFLCAENMGYAGRLNHPARQSHRILPLTLNNEQWYIQYSPYVYFNEHCIVLKGEHIPMLINRNTFVRLLEFLDEIPHYFLGSNAGLPIVGGSILNHDHYQGGCYEMPMAKAPIYQNLSFNMFKGLKAGLVKWPMTCIRLQHKQLNVLADAADYVRKQWEVYSDEQRKIFASTKGVSHNAVTPIARMRDGLYEIDLVLRNNITSDEHELGVFHPHEYLHHIKKENIGLIEVMGVFILPGRLKNELAQVTDVLLGKIDINNIPESIEKHLPWIKSMQDRYKVILPEEVNKIIQKEIGSICTQVLGCAGVFKDTKDGRMGLYEFVQSCSMK